MQRIRCVRTAVLLLLLGPLAGLSALGNPEEGDFQPVEGGENWEHRFDISGLEEGKYNLVIRGTDQAGNVALQGPFNLFVDPASDLPVVHVSNPARGQRVSGQLNVVGTCLDDDGVERVEVQLDDGPFQAAEGGELWSRRLDLLDLTEGEHSLTARGVDVNGKTGEPVTVGFSLDRGAPVVEVTSHPNGALVSGRITLEGTVRDGNGVSSVAIGTTRGTGYAPVKVGFDKNEQLYTFKHDLDTKDLEDGPLVLWLRATDRGGTSGEQAFLLFVNNEEPLLELLWPPEDAALNGRVTVVGRAMDRIGLKSLDFETTDGASGEVELVPGNPYWSQGFDFSATKQANVQVTFTLENRTGNKAVHKLRLRLDPESDRPVVRIAFPAEGAELSGSSWAAGFVLDDDGGAKVEYSLDGSEAREVASGEAFLFELPPLTPGRHVLAVTASDAGGAASKPASVSFTAAGEAPLVTLTRLSGTAAGGRPYPGTVLPEDPKALLAGEIRFAGTSLKAEARFGETPYKTLTLRKGEAEGMRAFDLPLPRDLPAGRVELGIRATDFFGRTTEFRSFFFKGTPPSELGVVLDDARVGEVVRLTDGQPLHGYFGSGTVAGVELDPPVAEVIVRGEGTLITLEAAQPGVSVPTTVRVTAADGLVHEAGPFRFVTDSSAPELRVSSAAAGAWVGGELRIEGIVRDDSPLAGVEFALGGSETFAPLELGTHEDGTAFGGTVSLADAADGPQLVLLRAADSAGNVQLLPLPVLKDTASPRVSLTAPGSSDELNGLVSLIGRADDEGRVASVEFTEDGKTFSPVDYEPAPGGALFRHDLNLSRYDQVPESLAFRVTDASGNTTLYTPKLSVDLEADRPRVEIQIPVQGETIRSDFSISGMAFDDDAVGRISYRIDEGEFTALEGSSNFTIPVAIGRIGDNEHLVEVRAEDIGGTESVPVTTSFVVSTSQPVSLLSSPRIDEVVGGIVELVGKSEDPNGIKEVFVSFDNGTSFQKMDGTEDWRYPVDSRLLDDGTLALLIRAVDGTGTEGLFTTTINIDNQAPEVRLDTPQDGAVLSGRLTLGGRVQDNVELATLTAWFTPAGSGEAAGGSALAGAGDPEKHAPGSPGDTPQGEAPGDPTEAPVGSAGSAAPTGGRQFGLEENGVFNRELDIGGLQPGWYNLMLEATDRAGNRRYVARNVRLLESAAAEKIELLYPAPGEELSGPLSLSGRIESQRSHGEIVLLVDDAVRGSAPADPQGYFRFDLEAANLSDGEHLVRVEAGGGDAARLVSETRTLRYRRQGPWVSITSHAPGQFVTNRPYLEGRAGYFVEAAGPRAAAADSAAADSAEGDSTAAEPRKGRPERRKDGGPPEVREVSVSFDNGKSFRKAAGGDSWRLRLETGELPNGALHLLVKATFSDEQTAITRTLLNVDTRAPELALLAPQEGGRFNEEITVLGSARDNEELADVSVSLRPGDKSRYAVPKFIQGMYLDVHALGATYADLGVGLSFFDDNVKLQLQAGISPPGRFSGLVVGTKLLANIFSLPFSFFFGPSWDFFSMSLALGANFSYFTMSGDTIGFTDHGLVLGAVVAQLEFARFRVPDWRLLHTYSLYSEFQLWFISSDVEGGLAPKLTFGFRLGLF
jgi:hypothetical protein